MSKRKLYEIAKELKMESKDLIARAVEVGILVRDHLTSVDQEDEARLKRAILQPREGEVVETRVAKTVVRRRRLTTEEEAPRGASRPMARTDAAPAPEPEPGPVGEPEEAFAPVEAAHEAEPIAAEPVVEAPVAMPETAPEAQAPPQAVPEATPEPVSVSAPEAPPAAVEVPVVVEAPEEPKAVAAVAPSAPVEEPVRPQPRRTLLHIDPDARPTERQAVVIAPPPPGFQPPRPPGQRPPMRTAPGRGPGGGPPMRTGDPRFSPTGPQPPDPRGPAAGPPRRGPVGAPPAPTGLAPRTGTEDDRRGGAKKPKGKQVFDRRGGAFNFMTAVDMDDIGGRGGRRGKRYSKPKKAMKTQLTTPKASKRIVKVEDTITVQEFAAALSVKASDIIRQLMTLGVMATVTQTLDFDTAETIALEFGFTVENVAFDIDKIIPQVEDTEENMMPRPPVVTVMGHVDHGKTSLLDRIRKARVADGEAGGITQHIGAYQVELDGGQLVFLDTPGHEAFTAMRARGAQVTDVVILVVAADDGVMPQTVEAINHAKEAGVPIIVAVNKIDKSNARPDRVLQELAEYGLQAEEWGGETIVCKVSAHTGEGIDHLLEMLLLQSEILDLNANPNKPARGVVIEAQLDRGRGPVASILVQDGTLRVGDTILTGTSMGRVRALIDDKGNKVEEATPATPVEVLGLDTVPIASENFYVVTDDKMARQIVDHRIQAERKKHMGATSKVSLDKLFEQISTGEVQELKIILKSDVHGSSEALKKALGDIKHDKVKVRIIHDGVGAITESDINLASASNAIIIGFSVRPEANAKALAEQEKVDIKLYTVIYDAIDDVKKAMEGLLAPTLEERALGAVEVRETFSVPKIGVIGGCMVTSGIVRRGAQVRLVRDSVQVWKGRVGSLRRFKDDVREVREGYECGLGLDGYNDIKVGDVIEVFEIIEVSQTLD